eukprot:2630587-Pyramimonas_sp.AAC.1
MQVHSCPPRRQDHGYAARRDTGANSAHFPGVGRFLDRGVHVVSTIDMCWDAALGKGSHTC